MFKQKSSNRKYLENKQTDSQVHLEEKVWTDSQENFEKRKDLIYYHTL